MKATLTVTTVILCSMLLLGCESVDSSDLATSGIYMQADASDRSNSGISRLELNVRLSTSSSPTSDTVNLSSGDAIYASLAGQRRKLSKESSGNYATDLPYAPGTLTVSLERSGSNESSEGSQIVLPEKLALENVGISAVTPDDSVVTFTYNGPPPSELDATRLSITCPDMSFDLGSFELIITDNEVNLADRLVEYNADKATEVSKLYLKELVSCEFTVEASLPTIVGSVDRALKGGTFFFNGNLAELAYPIEESAD